MNVINWMRRLKHAWVNLVPLFPDPPPPAPAPASAPAPSPAAPAISASVTLTATGATAGSTATTTTALAPAKSLPSPGQQRSSPPSVATAAAAVSPSNPPAGSARPVERASSPTVETRRYPVSVQPRDPSTEARPEGGGVECFDTPAALAINRARMDALFALGLPLAGKTVLDAGCGVGHLTNILHQHGCRVVGVEGRDENIQAMRQRYPHIPVYQADVQNDDLTGLGRFEVVFSFGLLYHTEDPVRVLRNLAAVCDELLILETIICDSDQPVMVLADEPWTVNQALTALACRPSPAFVAMALNRIGFPFVYATYDRPAHPDFQFDWRNDLAHQRDGANLRCMFVASRTKLHQPGLVELIAGTPRPVPESTTAPTTPGRTPAVQVADEVWVDVGMHLGEKTFEVAQVNPRLRVYAFEPNLELAAARMGRLPNYTVLPLAVAKHDGSANFHVNALPAASSLLPLKPDALHEWIGGEQLAEVRAVVVPTIRLDTFMRQFGIERVDYLKIDAQGADLAVVESLGVRIRDVRRIDLVVQITPKGLYAGGSDPAETVAYLQSLGFELRRRELQSHGQEENLTFERIGPSLASLSAGRFSRFAPSDEEVLALARRVAWLRPLGWYPGWRFNIEWDSTDPRVQLRRRIWERFAQSGREVPLQVPWYFETCLELTLSNDTSQQIFVAGCTEPNELTWLAEVLRPGMTFVDAGANEGLFTTLAARCVGVSGRVVAIEPSSREIARLKRNVELNGLTNVSVVPVALSDHEGQASLHIAQGRHAGLNSLGMPCYATPVQAVETVPLRPLDAVCRELAIERVDVMKIDVEGAEAALLRGAEQIIRRDRPAILLEVNQEALANQGSSATDLLAWLESAGYTILHFGADGRPSPDAPRSDNVVAWPH